MPFFDTIVAPITGNQRAAVAVVRVSGPDSFVVAAEVFRGWKVPIPYRYAQYGHFAHGDDGLAVAFEEGHSYTGEASVEFSVHGSPTSVSALVELCISAGARLAEPGEFTQRAFLNGRIDLAQAEAVREVIDSRTEAQFRASQRNLRGVLSRAVDSLRDDITTVLVAVEASMDFSEEIGDFDAVSGLARLEDVAQRLQALRDTYERSRPLRQGIVISIAGAPNVGKSSLFNAILGYDRAIVTPIPGTTRDVVGAAFEMDGIPCELMDTAGLRTTEDQVERIGIELSEEQLRTSDVVWYVYDASVGLSAEDEVVLDGLSVPYALVGNKSDLVSWSTSSEMASAHAASAFGRGRSHISESEDGLRVRPGEGIGNSGYPLPNPLPEGEGAILNMQESPSLGEGVARYEPGAGSVDFSEQSSVQPPHPSPLPLGSGGEGAKLSPYEETDPHPSRHVGTTSPCQQGEVGRESPSYREGVLVSAATRDGLPDLLSATTRLLGDVWTDGVASNERHQPLLAGAQESINQAIQTIKNDLPSDLVSVCLRDAVHQLGLITGDQVTPDILERIFHDFCIGK